MTCPRMGLLGLSALLGALGGCATPPAVRGGTTAFPAQAARAQHPGPGWLLLGSDEDGSLYMHPRSTQRIGSSAFIVLVGKKRQPVVLSNAASVGSVKERFEIACETRRYRRHDGTVHPDQFALGPVLGSMGQGQWEDVPPNTVIAAVSSAVCSAPASDTTAPDIRGAPPRGATPEPAPAEPSFPRTRGDTFRT